MLILAFFLSTFALILQCILQPPITLLAYVPFLALAILSASLVRALWLSALVGVIMDLISNHPFGIHPLNYVLVTALLFRVRQHFLKEEPFHLSVLAALFSLFATIGQALLLFLFDKGVPLEGRWVLADFLGMPAIDGLYAFVAIAAPLALFAKCKKMWTLFWLKRKRLSRT